MCGIEMCVQYTYSWQHGGFLVSNTFMLFWFANFVFLIRYDSSTLVTTKLFIPCRFQLYWKKDIGTFTVHWGKSS